MTAWFGIATRGTKTRNRLSNAARAGAGGFDRLAALYTSVPDGAGALSVKPTRRD